MEFACITTTTDYGHTDAFASVLNAQLKYVFPQVTIIEVSHNIRKYDIRQAAYILRSSYRFFPMATLHLLDVSSSRYAAPDHLFFEFNGHFFVVPDNGVASLITLGAPAVYYRVPEGGGVNGGSFRMLTEVLPSLAGLRAASNPHEALGEPASDVFMHLVPTPFVRDNILQAQVVHVDGYENLITNIDQPLFKRFLDPGDGWQLLLKKTFSDAEAVHKLSNSVDDVEPGAVACYFGFDNMLHLGIRCGKAASLLGMKVDDALFIEKWSRSSH
jgi:S-adenosylmethionine hydrolase